MNPTAVGGARAPPNPPLNPPLLFLESDTTRSFRSSSRQNNSSHGQWTVAVENHVFFIASPPYEKVTQLKNK